VHLWRTKETVIVSDGTHAATIPNEWDALINRPDLVEYLKSRLPDPSSEPSSLAHDEPAKSPEVHPPIGTQEVWAAGVTYFRSRTARTRQFSSTGRSSRGRSFSWYSSRVAFAHSDWSQASGTAPPSGSASPITSAFCAGIQSERSPGKKAGCAFTSNGRSSPQMGKPSFSASRPCHSAVNTTCTVPSRVSSSGTAIGSKRMTPSSVRSAYERTSGPQCGSSFQSG